MSKPTEIDNFMTRIGFGRDVVAKRLEQILGGPSGAASEVDTTSLTEVMRLGIMDGASRSHKKTFQIVAGDLPPAKIASASAAAVGMYDLTYELGSRLSQPNAQAMFKEGVETFLLYAAGFIAGPEAEESTERDFQTHKKLGTLW